MNRTIVISGLLLIITGIILGAFGAHALKSMVSAEKVLSFETGVRYQLFQGLGLLVLGINAEKFSFSLKWVYRLLLLGTLLFSTSIYGLIVAEAMQIKLSFLGPITPIGGLLMISAWVFMMIRLINDRQMSE